MAFHITAAEKEFILRQRALSKKTKEGAFLVIQDPDSGKYLMGLRAKGSNNAGKWGFFGGNIDEGEKPIKSAKREWKEETNTKPPKLKKLVTLKNKKGDRIMHFFTGKLSADKKLPLNKAEHSKYKWFKLKKLPGPKETNPPARFIIKYLKGELK